MNTKNNSIIGRTANCVRCMLPAITWSGHVCKGEDIVTAGWCSDLCSTKISQIVSSSGEGCVGHWHEALGISELGLPPRDDIDLLRAAFKAARDESMENAARRIVLEYLTKYNILLSTKKNAVVEAAMLVVRPGPGWSVAEASAVLRNA